MHRGSMILPIGGIMRQNPNFILREIYNKSLLIPIKYNDAGNDPIYLNEVAAVIWKLSSEAEDRENLLSLACQTYQLEESSAESASINSFINQLIESHLILVD